MRKLLVVLLSLILTNCAARSWPWQPKPVQYTKSAEEYLFCAKQIECDQDARERCSVGFRVLERPKEYYGVVTLKSGDRFRYFYRMVVKCL